MTDLFAILRQVQRSAGRKLFSHIVRLRCVNSLLIEAPPQLAPDAYGLVAAAGHLIISANCASRFMG